MNIIYLLNELYKWGRVKDLFKKVYVKVEKSDNRPIGAGAGGPQLLKKVAGNCVKKVFKQ